MKPILQGETLINRAKSLGVSIYANAPPTEPSIATAFNTLATEAEIQKRVIDAELRQLAQRSWVIALISAIAAALSAGASLVAVLFAK